MTAVILRPTANGDLIEFPIQFPSSGQHFDKVDEVIPDELATYIQTNPFGSAYYRDIFHLPDGQIPSGSTIQKVEIWDRAESVATEGRVRGRHQSCVKTHGTVYLGTETAPPETFTDILLRTYTTNPFTNLAWTLDEIDALQSGVRARSLYDGVFECYATVEVTQCWIVVYFTPAPVAGAFIGDGLSGAFTT